MMYQFQNKKQSEERRKIIRNLVGLGVFFILCVIGFLSYTGRFFNFVGRPLWKIENSIGQGFYNVNYFFKTKASVSKENHDLIDEVSTLRAEMADYQILKNDVTKLRELMGNIPEKKNFVLGDILTKPSHSPYDTILIDIGGLQGVKEGNKVYVNAIIPIGIVSQVNDKTSLVTLYSSPGQKTEGAINGDNITVELVGRGGGNFEMIVPLELQIDNGTVVYAPGNSSEVLAVVDKIISAQTDPFRKVLLSSPVNIQNLKWVEVEN